MQVVYLSISFPCRRVTLVFLGSKKEKRDTISLSGKAPSTCVSVRHKDVPPSNRPTPCILRTMGRLGTVLTRSYEGYLDCHVN